VSAEITEATEAEVTLVAGGGGVFDVRRDGELVFSKFESGRFPDVGEIAQLL
jgi:predicted Rdx family selenoprotein